MIKISALFSKNKYTNVKIVEQGGWHFSKVKNEKDIYYLLSNYGEHNEFENSGLSVEDYKKFINEGVLPYDHFLDKNMLFFSIRRSIENIKNKKNYKKKDLIP